MSQEEARRKLWELAEQEERKQQNINVVGTVAKGTGKIFSLLLRGAVLFVTTAVGLCIAICKMCFGFFFR